MPKFYTVAELAELFHVDEATIRDWLRTGYLRGTKIGSRWLVSQEQLDEFLRKVA
jgi:excisionase family DNA binding protein